jgi:hypothetical protein
MVLNYPRNTPHEAAPEWTLDYALEVADVPMDKRKGWDAGNIREKFHEYLRSASEGELPPESYKIITNFVIEKFMDITVEKAVVKSMLFPAYFLSSFS